MHDTEKPLPRGEEATCHDVDPLGRLEERRLLLGKLAYAAYCAALPAPTAKWDDVLPSFRSPWIAAADAIEHEINRENVGVAADMMKLVVRLAEAESELAFARPVARMMKDVVETEDAREREAKLAEVFLYVRRAL